ncbi:MAG: single-stranded-DNA-specific exonuclease RecJ [Chloroflexi bacterium]|nr:MAG: single-stranded-DNA-specific exonuclease RecJ [Chloroflexota bacterium]
MLRVSKYERTGSRVPACSAKSVEWLVCPSLCRSSLRVSLYKWVVAPPPPPLHLARFPHLPPLVVQVLYNRGITSPEEVKAFLEGEEKFHNPFRLKGMSQAVTRIRKAIRHGEPIAVYGDFDVDGVTATAILVETLRALGGHVIPYIPDRVREGYGLNKMALHSLAHKGIKVVVTADCGIRSVEEAKYARRIGLDLIITDHHSIGPEIPQAVAVINPKQEDCLYPFGELAGVGVAFKLAQALLLSNSQVPLKARSTALEEEAFYDLVALGTVADMVPLLGENRSMVIKGLRCLNSPRRPGIRALMQVAGLAPGSVDSTAISFILGPRLNAPGRLSSAMLSLRLLMSQDEREALELARQLDQWNRRRQRLMNQALEKARQKALDEMEKRMVILVADREFIPGIVGLVASKLVEEFYRPAIVMELGPERSRGSARSIPEFNITAALDQCASLLRKYGGHSAAAGLTIDTHKLPEFQERIEEIAEQTLGALDLKPTLFIDAEVSLAKLNWDVYFHLSKMEPFGYANPEPLFLSRGVRVQSSKLVGEDANHLRLTLADPKGSRLWNAIAFKMGDRISSLGDYVDVVYTLKADNWGGERRLQLCVKDIRPSEV